VRIYVICTYTHSIEKSYIDAIEFEFNMRQRFTYLGLALPILVATVFTAGAVAVDTDIKNGAEAAPSKTHEITLAAQPLDNGLLAYQMVSHTVDDGESIEDRTGTYSEDPTIPGPTIIIDEGDEVFLTLQNELGSDRVSVHVHGVHYEITSDGTLQVVNGDSDQGATPGNPDTFHWIAGPGTAGTWPYHDHTFGGLNGSENKGLFGTLIVNPASGEIQAVNNKAVQTIDVDDLDKQFVLYLGDDAFWGTEIDDNGVQTPLWTNPTLGAKTGDYVRFHLIALGTDTVHEFDLDSYQWLEPGTENLISSIEIGPLENHVFTVKAKNGNSVYEDENRSNDLMGMQGIFKVTGSGANSVASPVPDPF
jgi:FtsP/CotA-like multicopper oxidase with cupredoxin domain